MPKGPHKKGDYDWDLADGFPYTVSGKTKQLEQVDCTVDARGA